MDMATAQVRCALRAITVEQFATLFEPSNPDKISFDISLTVKSNYDDQTVALSLTVRFIEENRPFLMIEDTCHFLIKEEDWNKLSNGNTSDVELTKEILGNLFSITVGTTRGVLHAKTEQTPYNRFFLPLLDATKMITRPVTIEKTPQN